MTCIALSFLVIFAIPFSTMAETLEENIEVSYELQDNVIVYEDLSKEFIVNSDGKLEKNSESTDVTKGDILLDKKTEISYLVNDIENNIITVEKADVEDTFESIEIPEQSIKLDSTDIDEKSVASGLSLSSTDDIQIVSTNDEWIKLPIDYTTGDDSNYIKLNGDVNIISPEINVLYDYTYGETGEYDFNTTLEEKIDMDIEVYGTLDMPFDITLYTYEVGLGDIGSIYLSVDLIIDIYGNGTIEVNISQGASCLAGVSGTIDSLTGIPSSCETYGEPIYDECDINVNGSLSGSLGLYLEPKAGLIILGTDVLNIYTKPGIIGSFEVVGENNEYKYTTIDIDAYLKVGAYVIFIGDIKIYEETWNIYSETY
jgi:hypothetical protein